MILDIPLICTIIAIIACFYASYTDLKSGIIPNKLTYSLVGLGIGLNVIYAIMVNNLALIVISLIFVALIYVISYIFWRFGAWAGGDAKLFTGLAALLPFYPGVINYSILGVPFPVISTYGFPFTIIINSILSMLPFLLIYVLYIAIKRKPYLIDELLEPIKAYKNNIVLALVTTSSVTLTYVITSYFHISSYFQYQIIIVSLILIYLLSLIISKLPGRLKAVVISVTIAFVLYSNINNLQLTITGLVILFVSIFVLLIVVTFVKKLLFSVNKKALQDEYEIKDLKEGMIPVYKLYCKEDKVFVDDVSFSDRIRESIDNGDPTSFMKPRGNLLISTMAAGLKEDDIALLKKLSEENKIDPKIKIRRGVPFAPSILIGLLISLFIGDLAFILQKILYVILY